MFNQFSQSNNRNQCPLCGRKGADDHRFCSECFHVYLDRHGQPASLRVKVYGSNEAAGFWRPSRWVLILLIVLMLAGSCWGWSQFRQGKDNPEVIKTLSHPKPIKKLDNTNNTPAVEPVPKQAPISEPARLERRVKSMSRDKKIKAQNETNMPAEAGTEEE